MKNVKKGEKRLKYKIMEKWKNGKMEKWNNGVMEKWKIGWVMVKRECRCNGVSEYRGTDGFP